MTGPELCFGGGRLAGTCPHAGGTSSPKLRRAGKGGLCWVERWGLLCRGSSHPRPETQIKPGSFHHIAGAQPKLTLTFPPTLLSSPLPATPSHTQLPSVPFKHVSTQAWGFLILSPLPGTSSPHFYFFTCY